ncbi:MAG: hypothetical protein M3O31_16865 [Acidobacteriota bacterium]|nr:hypothetical protein [Acidobacteriota bacterium]
MSQDTPLSQPSFTLTDSEFEAVLALVCCFLDGSPLSQTHVVQSSYRPPDLKATRSLLSSARVKMEAGYGTMDRSTLLQDETIALYEIVAYFAQEYPRETATEIGEGALTQVPLPVILAELRSAVTKLAGPS